MCLGLGANATRKCIVTDGESLVGRESRKGWSKRAPPAHGLNCCVPVLYSPRPAQFLFLWLLLPCTYLRQLGARRVWVRRQQERCPPECELRARTRPCRWWSPSSSTRPVPTAAAPAAAAAAAIRAAGRMRIIMGISARRMRRRCSRSCTSRGSTRRMPSRASWSRCGVGTLLSGL